MPSVDIQILEGVFSEEERTQMIKEVTQVFVNIAGDETADSQFTRMMV
ncbi:tautomerase family protein [Ruegeria arenilitoris]|nr:tautomerase family protein [Ruegeria arenilitoris]